MAIPTNCSPARRSAPASARTPDLLAAGCAPRRPEVHHQHLPAPARQRPGLPLQIRQPGRQEGLHRGRIRLAAGVLAQPLPQAIAGRRAQSRWPRPRARKERRRFTGISGLRRAPRRTCPRTGSRSRAGPGSHARCRRRTRCRAGRTGETLEQRRMLGAVRGEVSLQQEQAGEALLHALVG